MAKFSLRRPDSQATFSVILSLCSLFFVIGLAVLVFKNFTPQDNYIIWYSRKTMRMPAILACTAIAALLAIFGLGFGFNSAGQRRNEKSKQSWLGFFLGAFAFTLAVILVATFFVLAETK